jgi:hypothetical protein
MALQGSIGIVNLCQSVLLGLHGACVEPGLWADDAAGIRPVHTHFLFQHLPPHQHILT